MRSAKELCAMLITRSLKGLNEEEEDVLIDYMYDIGIEVEVDTKPKDMCVMLLEKTMQKDLGRRVPISAYANSLLGKEEEKKKVKKVKQDQMKTQRDRKAKEEELEKMDRKLPGCIPGEPKVFSKTLYEIIVNPGVGIVSLDDGTSQYTSLVSVSDSLYQKIFMNFTNPVLEITTSKGKKAYARVGEPHAGPSDLVYISPLIGALVGTENRDGAFIKLCSALPEIKKLDFTYYGKKEDLEKILPKLREKLPAVINAFSYLSLGMVLNTTIGGKKVEVRVDRLEDNSENPIFSGLLPFGESDLPFEVVSDL